MMIIRTPLTYYGGKQQLAATILKLAPEHKMYVDPFMGGGAIFFAKEPNQPEAINGTNGELINFYEVIKRAFSGSAEQNRNKLKPLPETAPSGGGRVRKSRYVRPREARLGGLNAR